MKRVARQFVPIRDERMQVIEAKLVSKRARCVHQTKRCIEGSSSAEIVEDLATHPVRRPGKVVERKRYDRANIP
jgi:hypothetical protein